MGDTLHQWEWNLVFSAPNLTPLVQGWVVGSKPYILEVYISSVIFMKCSEFVGTFVFTYWLKFGQVVQGIQSYNILTFCGAFSPNFQCPIAAKLYVRFESF